MKTIYHWKIVEQRTEKSREETHIQIQKTTRDRRAHTIFTKQYRKT